MVNLAFVGAGSRAVHQMTLLLQMPEVEITGLCDVAPEAVDRALREVPRRREARHRDTAGSAAVRSFQPPTFRTVEEMLERAPVDAVYVSLPPFAHGPAEHAVIDAGKALMVEKPVALTMTVAREVAQHAREKGVIAAAGYQWRYSPAVQKAREILSGVPIGLVLCVRWSGLPGTPWWRVQEQGGGMLIEQHTHGVDLLRYLCGEVTEVYAAAETTLLKDTPGLDIADVNAVTLRLASGGVGTISNSCAAAAHLPGFHNYLYILAREMVVVVSPDHGTVVHRGKGEPEQFREHGDPNDTMNRAFIQAVQTGDPAGILSSYEEGMRTFELTYAAHLSAVQRRPVRIGEAYP